MATLTSGAPRITQTTFDEAVRENMEDFDMDKDSALQEAIAQFGAQGVDMVNIDTSGVDRSKERQATTDALEALKLTVTKKDGTPDEAVCKHSLKALIDSCTNDVEGIEGENAVSDKNVAANQSVIAMANGPEYIAALLGYPPLIEECLDCLKVITVKSVEVRDCFPPSGMFKISEIINQYASQDVIDENAYSMLTKCCDVVYLLTVKTEPNKQGFVRKETGGLKSMYALLKNCSSNPELVRSACLALRSICTFDDLRKDFAGAYDAAKAAVALGFVVELLRVARAMEQIDPEALAAVYTALRAIACNDESVQQICAGGGLTMAEGHLQTHQTSGAVVRQAAALLRNLAGNDSVKTSLCSVETLELLITAVSTHPTDAQLAEHVIATFAAMALRVPTNCDRILAMGGGRLISGSMRRFPNVIALQRQSCLAVRNLVGRSPHLKEPLLEDDMEGLLRAAGTQSGSIDAAFAALRDLGLEVEMVTVDPLTGEVRKGVQQFGEVKSSFRAVYDNDPELDNARTLAMAAAAQSPAELGYNM